MEVQTLGNGVVAKTGRAEAVHFEDPVLLDRIWLERFDLNPFGADLAGGNCVPPIGDGAADLPAGAFVVEGIVDAFLDACALELGKGELRVERVLSREVGRGSGRGY